MLDVNLDEQDGIVLLTPDGALTEDDFKNATTVIDNYIDKYGDLNGLIIHSKDFPGWDSFGAFIEHFKFIKNHHEKVTHVAIVTDSMLGDFGEKVASHFVNAEIKHFAFDDYDSVKNWILTLPE